jgi:hypothetical protein
VHFLYPSHPLNRQTPDEQFTEEYEVAQRVGSAVSLLSFELFREGSFRVLPALGVSKTVAYRGWMVTPSEYSRLHAGILEAGSTPLTSPQQYELCHYLPRWYPELKEFTAETLFFREADDIVGELGARAWSGCFLKDYVKSLSAGSLVRDLSTIRSVVTRMKQFRGEIEGGICARRIEEFEAGTEERYFVYRGKAHASAGAVPEVVEVAARRISSPFFTVDAARRRDGVTRIIELGDGQVSDRKQWSAEALLEILKETP